jgi:chromosome partitioning protein
MIITIGSKKGGVGKSTLSTNIAAWLAVSGKSVVLVDADRQSTSANWAADRSETDRAYVVCVQKYDNIKNTLRDLAIHYEYVIVDCQGRDSIELRTALLACDICVVPCCPSQADLDTIDSVASVIEDVMPLNEVLRAFYVLTKASTNPAVTEIVEAQKYLSKYSQFTPINTIISERKIYRDALAEGAGVVEMDNDKAAQEINNFMKEILSWA